jgi:threonine aldolase
MIELRSDTFTLPTPAMREAIATAPLGDDVYGEDPTVRALEELAADKLGKAAACLMPSGTMANLSSIMAHCPRGSKILVGNESDIFLYESGGASVCGGIVYEPIPTQVDGRLLLADLAAAFPEDSADPQFALPALICLENTHNRSGGRVLSLDYLRQVALFAQESAIPIHMDGARIFNAAIALDISPAVIARYADSVQFCLSKGLAAPVGSMVVGTAAFIEKVRRIRKMLGGAMRQSGIVAAAGIVALEQMVDRLREDHSNARLLAEGLARLPTIQIDLDSVETNIVVFRVIDDRFTAQTFVAAARRCGLQFGEFGHGRLRAVTYFGITTQDIHAATAIIENLLRRGPEQHFAA